MADNSGVPAHARERSHAVAVGFKSAEAFGSPVRRLLALAFLLAAASGAAAQVQEPIQSTTGVILSDIGGNVPPGVPLNLTITVTYRHGQGGVGTDTDVTLEVVEVPPWANFTVETTEFSFPTDPVSPPEGRATTNAVLLLSPDAPAFRRGNLSLQAVAEPNGNIRGSTGATQVFVIPGFNATLRLDAPPEVRIRGGLDEEIAFTVENLGNAAASIAFDFPSKPETARIVGPEPVVLAPGESAERAIGIRASWVEAGSGILTIAATPAIEGRTLLDVVPTTVDVLVTSLAAVPGGSALAALAAAATGAATRGRRRP